MPLLSEIWNQLREVKTLSFEARSAAQTGWNGEGIGVVEVSEPFAGVLIFTEAGYWKPLKSRELRFTNSFRWTLLAKTLRLEHLRFGADQPVFLFDLGPSENDEWRPITPHSCGKDCYSGSLTICDKQLLLHWSIQGPHKDESIRYVYS